MFGELLNTAEVVDVAVQGVDEVETWLQKKERLLQLNLGDSIDRDHVFSRDIANLHNLILSHSLLFCIVAPRGNVILGGRTSRPHQRRLDVPYLILDVQR